ncbi:MAG TPA: hypothetical protein PK849_13950, partial [Synergistales bacterium]|nr:hypothetical protein [Synergistales bacterium]
TFREEFSSSRRAERLTKNSATVETSGKRTVRRMRNCCEDIACGGKEKRSGRYEKNAINTKNPSGPVAKTGVKSVHHKQTPPER